jgi:hypothetical protein
MRRNRGPEDLGDTSGPPPPWPDYRGPPPGRARRPACNHGPIFFEAANGAGCLFAGADEHDAEAGVILQASADHLLVAVLEDVQGQHHAWEKDGVQGEER